MMVIHGMALGKETQGKGGIGFLLIRVLLGVALAGLFVVCTFFSYDSRFVWWHLLAFIPVFLVYLRCLFAVPFVRVFLAFLLLSLTLLLQPTLRIYSPTTDDILLADAKRRIHIEQGTGGGIFTNPRWNAPFQWRLSLDVDSFRWRRSPWLPAWWLCVMMWLGRGRIGTRFWANTEMPHPLGFGPERLREWL